MIKVVGVCGSPRKKSTYTALQAALDAAKATGDDVEVELIELRGRKINYCIHCNKCVKEGSDRCTVFNDDMTELYDKVYNADALIFGSPVYYMNVTAQMATFIGRFRSAFMKSVNDPEFFNNKVGAVMAVGGARHGGQETTMNALTGFFHTVGIPVCNGGGGMYEGAGMWNPGDGSTDMDDPVGLENAKKLGVKVANLARVIKKGLEA